MKIMGKISSRKGVTQDVLDKPQIQKHTSKGGPTRLRNRDEEEPRSRTAYINEKAPLAKSHHEQY